MVAVSPRVISIVIRLRNMHCQNFNVCGDNIGIEVEGAYLDLHNNYDFVGYVHIKADRKVVFTWRKTTGEWVREEDPKSVQLTFEDVSIFRHQERDPEMPESEDRTISYIGFLHPRDVTVMNAYAENIHIDDSYHFVLGLESEEAFKVEAKVARCHIGIDV